MKTLTVVMFALLLVPAGAAEAGSVFSFNGQGYPLRRLDPRAAGMGGAGRALVDGMNLSSFNPALLGAFQRPAMAGQFSIQRRNVEDRVTSRALADGDITGLKAVFPFRFRGALTVGIEALTDVDITVADTVGTGGEEHLLGLKGTGGIGSIVIGFGQKVGDRLFLGAQADIVAVGTINETWTKDLLNAPSAFFSLDTVTRSQRGAQFTFGAVFTPSNLSVALTARPRATVTQRVLVENRLTTANVTAGGTRTDRDIRFPATVGFGLAYARSQRFVTAVDAEFAAWGGTGAGRHDTFDLAAGIQYQTLPDNVARVGRRYDLMAGAYYRTLYFATGTNDPVAEFGVTAGIGFPFNRQAGAFRWTLEVGTRGDVASHGASETFFRQTFSVSGWIR